MGNQVTSLQTPELTCGRDTVSGLLPSPEHLNILLVPWVSGSFGALSLLESCLGHSRSLVTWSWTQSAEPQAF